MLRSSPIVQACRLRDSPPFRVCEHAFRECSRFTLPVRPTASPTLVSAHYVSTDLNYQQQQLGEEQEDLLKPSSTAHSMRSKAKEDFQSFGVPVIFGQHANPSRKQIFSQQHPEDVGVAKGVVGV